MPSFAELHPIFNQVHTKTQQSAGLFLQARELAIDAIATLNSVNTGGDLLGEPIGEFEKAVEGLGKLAGQLATIPDKINPYLTNNGLPPFNPIDASYEDYVATEKPEVPEKPEEAETSQGQEASGEAKKEPQFKEVAEDLQNQVNRMHCKRTVDPTEVEGFIGQGVENYVFDIENGTKVAKVSRYGNPDVKVPLSTILDNQTQKVEAMERAKGREGFEQLDEVIKANPDLPAVLVCEKAPGTTLISLSPEELDQIPEDHMDKLIANVAFANQNNIKLDTAGAGNNVMYDPEKGFTIIDYTSYENTQFKMPPDPEMVRHYARKVVFDIIPPKDTPLPPAKRRFYNSYKKAFGDEAARWLKFDFSIRHTIPEDL